MVVSIVFIVVFLILMSIVCGFMGFDDFELSIEIKTYNNPYFDLGMSFSGEEVIDEEGKETLEECFVIGLFFINIVLFFIKKRIDA